MDQDFLKHDQFHDFRYQIYIFRQDSILNSILINSIAFSNTTEFEMSQSEPVFPLKFTLADAQALNLRLSFHIPHTSANLIVSTFKFTQNLATSHHFHCYHSGPRLIIFCLDYLNSLLLTPSASILHSILDSRRSRACKPCHKSAQNPSDALYYHLELKPKS